MSQSSNPKKAILLGYYGAGNLGDELMLICFKVWLAAQNIEAIPFASDAREVRRVHGFDASQNYPILGQFAWVESWLRGKVFETLRKIHDADLVVCGGGDVIRDALGLRIFSYQIEKLIVALLCRKPIFLLNVGISRPVSWYGQRLLKWLLPRFEAIVVREQRSAAICRELGAGDRVSLLPDIVFRLPDFFPSARACVETGNRILVALHGHPNVYGRYLMTDARIQALADLLDSIVEQHDSDIRFFPFQQSDGGDLPIHEAVKSRMRHSERTILLNWTVDCGEIAARFSESRMVIAMRLHAAILATAYGKPCVLMPYDQKVLDFGREAELRHTLTPEMLDVPSVAKAVVNDALSERTVKPMLKDSGDWLSFVLPKT